MPAQFRSVQFAQIPADLIADAPDAYTIAVYSVLHLYGNRSDRGCFASAERIATDAKVCRRIALRCLKWLRLNGWVDHLQRQGSTTVYFVRPMRSTRTSARKCTARPVHESAPLPVHESALKPEPINQKEKDSPNGESKKPATKRSKADPLRLKQLPPDAVPLELLEHADLLAEYWAGKKGARSTPVFNRICRKLTGWPPEDRTSSLEAAIAGCWADLHHKAPEAAPVPSARPSRSSSYQDQFDRSQIDWDALNGKSFFPNAITVIPTNR
jgi:hypothetical protein